MENLPWRQSKEVSTTLLSWNSMVSHTYGIRADETHPRHYNPDREVSFSLLGLSVHFDCARWLNLRAWLSCFGGWKPILAPPCCPWRPWQVRIPLAAWFDLGQWSNLLNWWCEEVGNEVSFQLVFAQVILGQVLQVCGLGIAYNNPDLVAVLAEHDISMAPNQLLLSRQ